MSALSPAAVVTTQGRALVPLAFTLGAFFAASSAPTPLYRLYQEAWGFSPGTLTVVFAVYVLTLLVALLTTGSLSDHLGRRPVILAALVLEAVAMVMFGLAGDVQGLIFARALQGFATGMAAAALGAALMDAGRERGALINSLSPVLGMAVGGLGASELAQYAPEPLHLVFWLLLGVFVLSGVAMVLVVPETVTPAPGALASLRPKVRVPEQARSALARVAPIDIAVWALGGFYLSLGPSLMRAVTGSTAAGGWMVFIITSCAAAAMWTLRAWTAPRLLNLGASALVVGLGITLTGMYLHNLAVMLSASVIAGIGFGVGFQGTVRSVMPLAQDHERAGLLAAVYIMSYLAFSLPAIGMGQLAQRVGLVPASYGYCVILMLLGVISLFSARPRAPRLMAG